MGIGTTPLPRRRAWRTLALAALGAPAVVWFARYFAPGLESTLLYVALAASVVISIAGTVWRRLGWGMTGFALLYGFIALRILELLVSGQRAPAIGSVAGLIGLATHQFVYGFGYLVFLVVTIAAPVGILTATAGRQQRMRRWTANSRSREMFVIAAGVLGVGLIVLAVVSGTRSPWIWLTAVVAVGVIVVLVSATIRHPLLDAGERFAGWWIAAVISLPYAVLLPTLLGAPADAFFDLASFLLDWTWALVLMGAGVSWVRARRLDVGGVILLLVSAVAALRHFVHIRTDLQATVGVLVVVVAMWEVAVRSGWLRRSAGLQDARLRLVLSRAALLAVLVVGLLDLVIGRLPVEIVLAIGVVLAFVAVLLFDQPGRDLPPPLRGAAYVRAAAWAVVAIAAQGVMVAAGDGLELANGSQRYAAELLTLPLLVVYAGFPSTSEFTEGDAVASLTNDRDRRRPSGGAPRRYR